jgi:hypothetical protein
MRELPTHCSLSKSILRHFKFLQEERERRAEEAKIRKQQYDEERLRNEIAKVEEKVQIPAFQDEVN